MLGIEPYQLISFLRQLGLALAGAASLWGMVFIYLGSKRGPNDPAAVILMWIGWRLRYLLYGGGALAISMWAAIAGLVPASAHEGITLIVSFPEILQAAQNLLPVYLSLTIVLIYGLIKKNFKWIYLLSFILVFIAISHYTDFRGLPWREIVFHAFHGFHSIFTLGTVLVLDFMFLSSRSSSILQQNIFPLFPKISKVIWIGLSLDLLSVLLIFPAAVILSPRFFFAQTVIGILIINGVLLSGIITRRILSLLHEGRAEHSRRWLLFSNIAGTISVTSWLSLTFVDFFPSLTLSYSQLIGLYFSAIAALFIFHEVWNFFDKKYQPATP